MANIDLYKQKLVDIADAIREKLSEQSTYTLEQMPGKIESIPTGGGGIEIIDGYSEKSGIPKDISSDGISTFNSISVASGYQPITVTKE